MNSTQSKHQLATISIFASLTVCIIFLYGLGSALSAVILAFLFAYIFQPLLDRMKKYHLSRGVATTILAVAFFVGVGLIGLLIGPALFRQLQSFGNELPQLIQGVHQIAAQAIEKVMSIFSDRQIDGQAMINEYLARFKSGGPSLIPSFLLSGLTVFDFLLNSILFVFLFFFFLYDFERVSKFPFLLAPAKHHDVILRTLKKSDEIFSTYFRSLIYVCACLSFIYCVGFGLSGVDYWLLAGLFAGLLKFVPIAGVAVSMVALVLFSYLNHLEPSHYIGIFITYGVAEFFENYILVPRIIGTRMGIHPLTTIFAIIVGGKLFGVVGMFLAIPTATVILCSLQSLAEGESAEEHEASLVSIKKKMAEYQKNQDRVSEELTPSQLHQRQKLNELDGFPADAKVETPKPSSK